MIDVNAVREGTRWTYLRREIEVDEVSPRFVVFREPNGLAEVAPLPKFLAGAKDPVTGDYEDVLRELEKCARTPSHQQVPGVQECLLRDAVIHILKRLGPPAPLNVAPPAPMPAKPEPVALPAEPDPEPECLLAAPDEVLAPAVFVESPYAASKRRKAGSWVA